MKVIVKRHHTNRNKGGIRVRRVLLAPVCKGVWAVHADMKVTATTNIYGWGSDGNGDESVYFGDGQYIFAEIKFLPENKSERNPRLIDRLLKDTYEGFLVADNLERRAWEKVTGIPAGRKAKD